MYQKSDAWLLKWQFLRFLREYQSKACLCVLSHHWGRKLCYCIDLRYGRWLKTSYCCIHDKHWSHGTLTINNQLTICKKRDSAALSSLYRMKSLSGCNNHFSWLATHLAVVTGSLGARKITTTWSHQRWSESTLLRHGYCGNFCVSVFIAELVSTNLTSQCGINKLCPL